MNPAGATSRFETALEWQVTAPYIEELRGWSFAEPATGQGIQMDVIFGVLVRGRVQGVGYRAWAQITALELGVEGWVRNCRDGSVEAVFAGPEETVLTMIEACRDGPAGAQVTAVDQREADSTDLALRRPGEIFSVLATF